MKIHKLTAIPLVIAMMVFGFAGTADAQTAGYPTVQIQLLTTGLTNPLEEGDEDATMARLNLNTSGSSEAVRLTSLPFILATGSGALSSTLEECRVYNEANNDTALNSSTTLNAGLNNVVLSSPLVLAANTQTVISLRCDIGDNLVAGGTYTFSMNTANVVATGASTGLPAIVTVPGGAVIPPVVVVPPVTPGFPSTGANGDLAQSIMMITGAGLMAMLGIAFARRKYENS